MSSLDRILTESDAPAPSPGFVAAVMAAVRASDRAPAPLPVPWAWLAGTAAAALLAGVSALLGPGDALGSPPHLDRGVVLALGVLAASGLFSYLTVEWVRD